MSSFNFLQHNAANVPDASMMRFGIVVTEWNAHITEAMLKSAIDTLTEYGAMINGVLTVNNEVQAEERAGANMDKGREFAITAIKMVDFMKSFE